MKPKQPIFTLALAIIILGVLLYANPWLLLPTLHLRALLLGLLPLLSFFPIANLLLDRISSNQSLDNIERLIYASFLSLCLASAYAFILLTIHLAFPWMIYGSSLILILASWGWWRNRIIDLANYKLDLQSLSRLELTLLTVVLLLGIIAAVLPPVGYDAHEYHLAAPDHYIKTGSWVAFPYNVYAAFPMNTELLYMWPLASRSPAGCTAINLLFACIAALAVWRLGRIWGIPSNNLLAPLFFLATGLTQRLIIQANIDLALSASAIILLMAYERYRTEKRPIDAVMMAAALGFAFGSKYIAALSIGLPFCVMILFDIKNTLQKRIFVPLFLILCGGVAIFLPWAIRNWFLYQNPVFPLLTPYFVNSPDFFSEMFSLVHAPKLSSTWNITLDIMSLPFQKSLAQSIPLGFSALWLLGIPLIWKTARNHPIYRSIIFMTTAYCAWFFLTQRNDRFLASILPLMALLGGYGIYVLSRDGADIAIRGFALVIAAIQILGITTIILKDETAGYLVQPMLEDMYLAKRVPHYRAIDWLNLQKEEGRRVGRVLFVGEAQSYGARFEAIAPTVFNHHPLEKGLDRTITHILFNQSELNRLRKSYGPYGWPLGDFLQQWMDKNQAHLQMVFDAYPDNPGQIVVYQIVR